MLPVIESLSRTHILSLEHRDSRPEESASRGALVLTDAEIVIAAASQEHVDRIQEQLEKEATTTRSRLESVQNRLSDETFLSKAPAAVVDKQRELAASLRDKLARLETELRDLG